MMNPRNIHLLVADDAVNNAKITFYQFADAGIFKLWHLTP